MIPLTLPRHSEKPWQKGHPKRPSDKTIAHSAQGHLAPHLPLAPHLAGQRMVCNPQSDLRCAEPPSAYESGIFCFLFLLLKKRRSPHAVGTGVANASEVTNEEAEPNA